MDVPPWAHGIERHGGVLPNNERPWPLSWQATDLWIDCERYSTHRWEIVYLTGTGQPEFVVRCMSCKVPRCGSSSDPDPCMLRRHHTADRREHLPLSLVVPNLASPEEVSRWLAT